jgi:lytic murein transglycosylase
MMPRLVLIVGLLAAWTMTAAPALAARCGNNATGFSAWLEAFSREAASRGIAQRVVSSALNGVTYDAAVIRLDRNQKHFSVPYEEFIAKRVTKGRIAKGRKMMAQHGRLLTAIEKRFGVPGEIIVAIWGMETDYGVNTGKMNVFRSLATLAYDCRRSEFFTNELLSALQIIQRGDMSASQMKGAWAGELGQTQFLASRYLQLAVDFDGNGRRDLIRSVPDVLASTANYLKSFGWRRGGGFDQPALRQWNKSNNYTRALAYFAGLLKSG